MMENKDLKDDIQGGIFLAIQKDGKPLLSVVGELTLLQLAGLRSYFDSYVDALMYRSIEQSLSETPVDLRKKDRD